MTGDYQLQVFDRQAPAPAADLARLHVQLLPRSPLAKLGPAFLERFYYSVLPAQGFLFGAVARVANSPAGFVAVTADSEGFLRAALRRNWLRLAWIAPTSIPPTPRRLAGVWEALRILATRDPRRSREPCGELLSIGVLDQHRGRGIARGLMDHAQAAFRDRGLRRVRLIVDRDNLPAQALYQRLGWRLERSDVPGWHTPSLEFLWNPEGDATP